MACFCTCTGAGVFRDLSRGLFLQLSAVGFSRLFIPDSDYATVPLRQLQILAGAVREIEMDLRIPLYLSDTSPLTRRGIAAAGHYR